MRESTDELESYLTPEQIADLDSCTSRDTVEFVMKVTLEGMDLAKTDPEFNLAIWVFDRLAPNLGTACVSLAKFDRMRELTAAIYRDMMLLKNVHALGAWPPELMREKVVEAMTSQREQEQS